MNQPKIRITGFDTERTKPSRHGVDKELRQFHFALSRSPDSAWASVFEDVTRHNIHMRKRDTWVEGDALIVDCLPNEIEEQLEILKSMVEATNLQCAALRAKEQSQAAEQRTAQEIEQANLKELAKRLKFD